MNKKIMAIVLAFLLTIGLCGCQLAKPDSNGSQQNDRLVGAYITTEYVDLFDMDGYLQDNLDSIIAQNGKLELPAIEHTEKLYAVLTENTYAFPDLEGILLAQFRMASGEDTYISAVVDEGICNIDNRVGGEDAGISGTIWTAKDSGDVIFYLNPVYQTEDGQVYLIPGSGMHFSSGVAGRATQKMEETRTVTVNGERIEEHFAVEVAVDVTEPAETVTILQMDTENREISRTTYRADALPEELTPDTGTAYLIVQSDTKIGTQRQICQPGDQWTEVFILLDPQICIQHPITINW